MFRPVTVVLSVVVMSLLAPSLAVACPFCSAQSQTLSEEIASMDTVVVAKLVEAPNPDAKDEDLGRAMFEVTDILVGVPSVKKGDRLETIYFGSAKPGANFLVMGVDPPKIAWSTPLQLSDRAKQYVKKLIDLPDAGATRLKYFQKFLEDKDELLARDAYDEFARAPYADVIALKDQMDHQQIVKWIGDADIPASRRRLYLTMLGVCGSDEDLPMLEKMLRSNDRRTKAGLDAMIACYITLKGEGALPLIEELFLKDKDTEYSDTYAAIMALRFHGTEGDVVPQKRVVKSLQLMLQRPSLADLVIPDLARWQDWSQIDRMVELFKTADEKSSWVKVPVINYLRACPLPVAKKKLEELAKLDPETVERANTFFPFGGDAPKRGTTTEEDPAEAKATDEPAEKVSTKAAAN